MAGLNIDFPTPPEENTPFLDRNGYTWDYNGLTWIRRTQGLLEEAPQDGEEYARKDGTWVVVSHPQAEVPEAPNIVGKTYVRGELQWWEVTIGLGGISDAVADGKLYGRQDNVWVEIGATDLSGYAPIDHTHTTDEFVDEGGSPITVVEEAPQNGKEYVRKDAGWVENAPLAAFTYGGGITIMNPQAEDDATLVFTTSSITFVGLWAHIQGATSVTFNIHFGPTRNGAFTKCYTTNIVSNSNAGVQLAIPNTNSIPINSWIWLEIVSKSGDPEMFHLSFEYQKS